MRKALLALLLGFIFCLPSIAQTKKIIKHDSTAYYMRNDYDLANSESDAKSLRLIIKAKNGLFRIEDYYLDAKPKLLAESTINGIHFESGTEGERIDYYPTGNIKTITQYDKGQLIGDKESNYPNGSLYSVTTRICNLEYLKKYVDTAGNILADNGNGKWADFDNMFVMPTEGRIVDGKRVGEWVQTRTNGIKTSGVYKNGVLVSGDLFLQDSAIYSAIDTPPSFPGGDSEYNHFISSRVKYPLMARKNNVQGKVTISFIVEKDGTLTNVKVLKGIGSGCDQESARVISLSPKWNPGIINGKHVRVQYSVPVGFFLSAE